MGVGEGADATGVAGTPVAWGAVVFISITTAVIVGGTVRPGVVQASIARSKAAQAIDTMGNPKRWGSMGDS